MAKLDLSGPVPQVQTLSEAQQVINTLWALVAEQQAQIEQLKEQIDQLEDQHRVDSQSSSRPPSYARAANEAA